MSSLFIPQHKLSNSSLQLQQPLCDASFHIPHLMLALLAVAAAFSPPPVFTDPLAASLPAAPAGTVRSFPDASMTMEQVQSWLWGSLEAEEDQEGEPEEIERSSRRALLALKAYKAMYG